MPTTNNTRTGDWWRENGNTDLKTIHASVSGVCEIDATLPGDADKRTIYLCAECDFFCGFLHSMQIHKRKCTGRKTQKGRKSLNALKMFVCSDCGFSTTFQSEMMEHYEKTCNEQNSTHGKHDVGCQYEEMNVTKSPLVVMARPCTSSGNPDQPVKTKASVSVQTDYVRDIHPKKKKDRAECPYCPYSTARPSNIKAHIKTHTGEKPYNCTYCSKKFSTKASLMIHTRSHTGQRPYTCDECGKAFSARSVMVRHKIRWHTEERPYVCEVCFMGFKFKPDLNHHKKTHNFG